MKISRWTDQSLATMMKRTSDARSQVHVEITGLKNEECAGTATSYAAMAMRKSRAKQQAADTAVPWRYQGQ
jgi:hypothetical protein